MRRLLVLSVAVIVLGTVGVAPRAGAEAGPAAPPPCEPGYRMVEEIEYREITRKVCRVVPDVKKTTKWVYDEKVEDVCYPKCPGLLRHGSHHTCDGHCPACESHPRVKKTLVKRPVVEECPTFKCMVETIVERVPCKVYRKVPCPPTPSLSGDR